MANWSPINWPVTRNRSQLSNWIDKRLQGILRNINLKNVLQLNTKKYLIFVKHVNLSKSSSSYHTPSPTSYIHIPPFESVVLIIINAFLAYKLEPFAYSCQANNFHLCCVLPPSAILVPSSSLAFPDANFPESFPVLMNMNN